MEDSLASRPGIPSNEGDWQTLSPEALLRTGAETVCVPLSEAQIGLFLRYLDLLLDWNTRMNLTAIRDPRQAIIKHFLDSLLAVPLLPSDPGVSVVDVGTGAGFPGLVLKLARPDIHLLLLDSVRKRLGFLETVLADLGLKEVATLHLRAEDAGRDPRQRERYDTATARAVAPLPTLCEWCLPLVKPGGIFLALKGPRGDEELQDALPQLKQMGAVLERNVHARLPYLNESRQLLLFRKKESTPTIPPARPGGKSGRKRSGR